MLSRLDVDMCNVHAAGTIEMMRAAVEGLTRPDGTRPVTDRRDAAYFDSEERMQRELLIRLDQRYDRQVCAEYPRSGTGRRGLLAAGGRYGEGGLRKGVPDRYAPACVFADGEVADQVRVTTPARAREIGSDYIVVGRPITAAADPVAAYRRCVEEFVK